MLKKVQKTKIEEVHSSMILSLTIFVRIYSVSAVTKIKLDLHLLIK